MRQKIAAALLAVLIGSMAVAGCADADVAPAQPEQDTIGEPIPEEEVERLQEQAEQAAAEQPKEEEIFSSIEEYNAAEEAEGEGETEEETEPASEETETAEPAEEEGTEASAEAAQTPSTETGSQTQTASGTGTGTGSAAQAAPAGTSGGYTWTAPAAQASAVQAPAQPAPEGEAAPTLDELRKLLKPVAQDGLTADQLVTLGLQYQDGIGVPQWYGMAEACFAKAQSMGDASAATAMATLSAYKGASMSPEMSPNGLGWIEQFYNQGAAKEAAGDWPAAFAAYCDDVFFFEDPLMRGLPGIAKYLVNTGNAAEIKKGMKVNRYIGEVQGIGSGCTAIGDIYQASTGTYPGVESSLDRAMSWYEKAFSAPGLIRPDGAAARKLADLYARGYFTDNGTFVGMDTAKAMETYEKAAALGDRQASYRIGKAYADGDGVFKDAQKAASYFLQALDGVTGNEAWIAEAQNELGRCYEAGKGVDRDLDKAEDCYRKGLAAAQAVYDSLPADANKSEAKARVLTLQEAMVRLDQRPLSKSDLQKLLAVKADSGSMNAGQLEARGDAYMAGTDVPLSYSTALAYYQAAEKAGSSKAKSSIAALENLRSDATNSVNNLEDGTGVLNDLYNEAKAALASGRYNEAYARFHDLFVFFGDPKDRGVGELADMIRDGVGTERRPDVAYQLLLYEGVEKGDGDGFYRISEMYSADTGTYAGFTHSDEKALWFARRSYEDPSVETISHAGAYAAGVLYDKGIMTDAGQWNQPDYEKATECFKLAAEDAEEVPEAYYKLGSYYELGEGSVEKDYTQAYTYYEKYYNEATKTGVLSLNYKFLAEDTLALGRLCETGLGTPKDLEKAKRFYEIARDVSTGQESLLTVNAAAVDAITRLQAGQNQ